MEKENGKPERKHMSHEELELRRMLCEELKDLLDATDRIMSYEELKDKEFKRLSDGELKSLSDEELKRYEKSFLKLVLEKELAALDCQIYEDRCEEILQFLKSGKARRSDEERQRDLLQDIEQGIKQIAKLYGLDPDAVLRLFGEVVTQRTVQ